MDADKMEVVVNAEDGEPRGSNFPAWGAVYLCLDPPVCGAWYCHGLERAPGSSSMRIEGLPPPWERPSIGSSCLSCPVRPRHDTRRTASVRPGCRAGLVKRYRFDCLDCENVQPTVDKEAFPTLVVAEAAELDK